MYAPRAPRSFGMLLSVTISCVLIASRTSHADWQQASFIVGGWNDGGAPTDTARFTKLNNAGLDFVGGQDNSGSVAIAKSFVSTLDALRGRYPGAFTMKGIVALSATGPDSVYDFTAPSQPSAHAASIRQAVNPSFGLNTDSVLGWFVWDEPFGAANDSAAVVSNILATYDSSKTKLPFVNLFPPYASTYVSGFSTLYGSDYRAAYVNYIRDYLSQYGSMTWPSAVACADNYELQNPSALTHDFLFTWRTLRDMAGEYGRSNYRIPMWSVIQLSRNTANSATDPPIGQVRNQAFEALAYGAKAITYWVDAPCCGYGDGILTSTGAKSSRYSDIQALNKDLHAVGNILFSCDPVTTWMGDSSGEIGVADDVMGSPNIVYNLVTRIGPNGYYTLVGHLKDRNNGDDYLLAVNKNSTLGIGDTIYLSVPAHVLSFTKSTGSWVDLGSNLTSFTCSLSPNDAELFKIQDGLAEYIPNVNAMAASGTRMYFAHQRGLSLVDYSTGLRRNVHDGTVYTPAVDVAVNDHAVYVGLAYGTAGNVGRWDRNLLSVQAAFYPGVTGPVSAVDVGGSRVLIGVSGSTGAGWVYRSDTTLALRDSVQITDGVNDVKYQSVGDAFIVAHRKGMQRRSCSNDALLKSWQDGTATTPVVRVAVDSTGVVAALDNGTNGDVQTIASDLASNQGGWTDSGAFPRCFDVALMPPSGATVLAASSLSSTQKFTGLQRSNMTSQWTVSSSSPKAVAYLSNQDAFMATPSGVLRRSVGGTMYKLQAPPKDGPPAAPRPSLLVSMAGISRGEIQHVIVIAPQGGRLRWEAYDVLGRRVGAGRWTITSPGQTLQDISVGSLASGLYFARFQLEGFSTLARFVVLR